ncbi:hypothetical protein BDV09DRAFT_162001 [Aspergillus tetrazonus]
MLNFLPSFHQRQPSAIVMGCLSRPSAGLAIRLGTQKYQARPLKRPNTSPGGSRLHGRGSFIAQSTRDQT